MEKYIFYQDQSDDEYYVKWIDIYNRVLIAWVDIDMCQELHDFAMISVNNNLLPELNEMSEDHPVFQEQLHLGIDITSLKDTFVIVDFDDDEYLFEGEPRFIDFMLKMIVDL